MRSPFPHRMMEEILHIKDIYLECRINNWLLKITLKLGYVDDETHSTRKWFFFCSNKSIEQVTIPPFNYNIYTQLSASLFPKHQNEHINEKSFQAFPLTSMPIKIYQNPVLHNVHTHQTLLFYGGKMFIFPFIYVKYLAPGLGSTIKHIFVNFNLFFFLFTDKSCYTSEQTTRTEDSVQLNIISPRTENDVRVEWKKKKKILHGLYTAGMDGKTKWWIFAVIPSRVNFIHLRTRRSDREFR